MQTKLRTRGELWGFNEALKAVANQYFKVPSGELSEAVAVGFGKRSQSSLIASLNAGVPANFFDLEAFVARLSELVDEETAEALGVMLDGVQLDIVLTKYSEQQMRAHKFSDVAYTVSATVRVDNFDEGALERSANFLLPEFRSKFGREPFRVDSAHTHRHSDLYAVSRTADRNSTVVARLHDWRWDGGLFVYSLYHQANDINCLKSVKGAMAKKILPAVSPRVRCLVFRPDHYSQEAHRIEVSLGQMYRKLLKGVELQFDIPKLPRRMVQIDQGYMGNDLYVGRLIDGQWFGDLYSNGVAEAENPTTLEAFRAELLAALHAAVRRNSVVDSPMELDSGIAIKNR